MKKLERIVFVNNGKDFVLCEKDEPKFEDFNFVCHHFNNKSYLLDKDSEIGWVGITEEDEAKLKNKILLKILKGYIYKVEIVIDREKQICVMIVHKISTKAGKFITMFIHPDIGELPGVDLPSWETGESITHYDVKHGSLYKTNNGAAEQIEVPIPFVIQNVLEEKIKELFELSKEDEFSAVNLRSKNNWKGAKLAELITTYPEFFKD